MTVLLWNCSNKRYDVWLCLKLAWLYSLGVLAPHNSKRGSDNFFREATHDLAHNNLVMPVLSSMMLRRYKQAPYAVSEASQNPCNSIQTGLSVNILRGIVME